MDKIISAFLAFFFCFSLLATQGSESVTQPPCDIREGLWKFVSPLPADQNINLDPFPQTILLKLISHCKGGTLTLQLASQSQPKVYPFSKEKSLESSKKNLYDRPAHQEPYTLNETAVLSWTRSNMVAYFKWEDDSGVFGKEKKTYYGRYVFTFWNKEDEIRFTRTLEAENGSVFWLVTARYYKADDSSPLSDEAATIGGRASNILRQFAVEAHFIP